MANASGLIRLGRFTEFYGNKRRRSIIAPVVTAHEVEHGCWRSVERGIFFTATEGDNESLTHAFQ
jgi:hypothetical protein